MTWRPRSRVRPKRRRSRFWVAALVVFAGGSALWWGWSRGAEFDGNGSRGLQPGRLERSVQDGAATDRGREG